MENNKRSRVQNMNDYVNNNISEDNLPPLFEPEGQEEFSPEEESNDVVAHTSFPSGHSVSASRYAGSSHRQDVNENTGTEAISEAKAPAPTSPQRQRSTSPNTRVITPKSSSNRTVTHKKSSQTTARQHQQNRSERPQNVPAKSAQPKDTEPAKKPNTRTTAANRKYSDIVDERRSRQAAVEAENQPEKKKRHVFRTLVILYSVLLFVIVAAGLVFLYIYLGKFEESQPNKVAESIAANYGTTARLTSFIKANADKIDCIDDINDFTESYTRYIEGKKVSYVEKNSSTADVPAYNLVTDGTIVGTFTLKKAGKGQFNTDQWELDTYDIVTSFPLGYTLNITVPQGSTVQVNDTLLDSGYISSSGIPQQLESSVQFMSEPPVFDTYSVPVLTSSAEVIAKDADGNTLELSQTTQDQTITYTAGAAASEDFIAEVDPLVMSAIEVWGLYFINMDSTLDLYIKQGTELYASIFGSEDMDPILTWLYNFEQIDDYEFEYMSASNYQKYSDECFTVDISYKLDITFTEEGMVDDNQKLDATWVWVPDGDSWSITEVIYK